MPQYKPADLIINQDGSVFHLHLKPGEIADHIILVGDPGRVSTISSHFSEITHKAENREFHAHTGIYKGTLISVVSTGIGTDNIDIVMNELDALVNIDLERREKKDAHSCLHFYRIGTSGALQPEIPVGSFLVTNTAIGFDGLLNFYHEIEKITNVNMERDFMKYVHWNKRLAVPYFVNASPLALSRFTGKKTLHGMTISAPGFYGPQGRVLRVPLAQPELNHLIESFSYHGQKITNFEMESSAIYGLSKHMGHHAVTLCAIIANRVTEEYISDYQPIMNELIQFTLDQIVLHSA